MLSSHAFHSRLIHFMHSIHFVYNCFSYLASIYRSKLYMIDLDVEAAKPFPFDTFGRYLQNPTNVTSSSRWGWVNC